MNIKSSDKKLTCGGRVSLRREVLTNLRKEKGLSQELVALMCAEQRLCVSISSIKRAETGKNILFRTARNISTFFKVNLVDIIDTGRKPNNNTIDQPTPIYLDSNRQIVNLQVRLVLDPKNFSVSTKTLWQSTREAAAQKFDCDLIQNSDMHSTFLFGFSTLMGYEHFQATHCAKWLLAQMQTILGHIGVIHCVLRYQQLSIAPNTALADMPIDSTAVDQQIFEIFSKEYAEKSLLCAADSIKQGLESQFELHVLKYCSDLTKERLWLVDKGKNTSSEVKHFIGRGLQTQQFTAAVESVYAYSEMQVVYIRGTAGIGKTRLLEEFGNYARGLGLGCHKSHVLDFGAEQHQTAIPQLIRSILGIKSDEQQLSYDELNQRLGHIVCEQHLFLFLYRWLNWPLAEQTLSVFDAMSPQTRQAGMHAVIQQIIQAVTPQSPLLLCIEDMHWADENLQDRIQHFAHSLKDAPIILLLTSRQENDPMQTSWASNWIDTPMLVMNLSPLRSKEALIFAEYFGEVSEDYKQQCIMRAEGNPLFLEQLLRHKSVHADSIPNTVQSLVLARLDKLPITAQTAARAASVIGQWFTVDSLNYVLQTNNINMSVLFEQGILKRSGDQIQFVHALIQQGIYQTISLNARSDFHQRCALWYEKTDVALQARHLNRARVAKATEVYQRAIKEKITAHQFSEAKILVAEVLDIDYTTYDKSIICYYQGQINTAEGNTELAVNCYQNSIKESTSDNQKYAALIGLAIGLDTLEKHDEALLTLEKAEACLSTKNIHRELSQIHYLRGNVYFPKGEVDNCRQEHSKALHYAQMVDDANAQAKALGGLGDAAYAQGKMITAYNYFNQCLDLCTRCSFTSVEAANRFMVATTRIYLNETKQALNDAFESAKIAESIGHKRAEIVSRLTAGWILLDLQHLDRAKQQIDLGMALATEISAHRFKPFLAESLARYHFYNGDQSTAKNVILDAEKDIQQQGIAEFIGPWIIGTHALVLGDDLQASAVLTLGFQLLEKKCIGHNYFRFYVNALESCLIRKDWPALKIYIAAFELYTQDEPTPWSTYYLTRARLILKAYSQNATTQTLTDLLALEKQGKSAHLNHTLILLTQVITMLESKQHVPQT